MATSGVGRLICLTNDTINWEIPSFHLLSSDENNRILSPVFAYYKYPSYEIPRDKFFSDTPKKSLGLIITSKDVKYNQKENVPIGITNETNTVVINHCHGVWIEQTDGNRYIKVQNIVNEENVRSIAAQPPTNGINLRFFFGAAFNEEQPQKVNASIQKEKQNAMTSSSSCGSADNTEKTWKSMDSSSSSCGSADNSEKTWKSMDSTSSCSSADNTEKTWRCKYCTLINSTFLSSCEVCTLPKSDEEIHEKLVSAVGNPSTNLPVCILCVSKERNIVLQPCGHLIICSECAEFRMNYCPLCRTDVKEKMKIFIN